MPLKKPVSRSGSWSKITPRSGAPGQKQWDFLCNKNIGWWVLFVPSAKISRMSKYDWVVLLDRWNEIPDDNLLMRRAEKGEGDITLCHTLIRTVDRGNSYCEPQQLQLQLSQIFVSAWIHFCRGGRHILNYFEKSNRNVSVNWVEKVVGKPVCSTTIAWLVACYI